MRFLQVIALKEICEIQADNIHCSPLIHQASHSIIKVYQVDQACLPFGESMLTTTDYFLVLYVPVLNLICVRSAEVNRKAPINFKKLQRRSNHQGKVLDKIKLCMCGNKVLSNIRGSRPLDV